MIKAIIFDCFGVLIGTGFKNTYTEAGGDPVQDKIFIDDLLASANRGLISSTEMRQKIANRLSISSAAWQSAVTSSETPHQELVDYIKQLKKVYKVAILSNANTGVLERKFSSEQMDLFDVVVVSAEIGMIKPEPAIYIHTATKLGVKPGECVFIDDSPIYCQAAREVGMQAICYKGNFLKFKTNLDQILSHA